MRKNTEEDKQQRSEKSLPYRRQEVTASAIDTGECHQSQDKEIQRANCQLTPADEFLPR